MDQRGSEILSWMWTILKVFLVLSFACGGWFMMNVYAHMFVGNPNNWFANITVGVIAVGLFQISTAIQWWSD